MNKKILLSLSIIVAVVAIVVGETRAYFSDSATSTSNSFHSGTLDLKLANSEGSYSDSITGSFDASDMAPGVTETIGIVYLKNAGSVPGILSISKVENTPSDNGINEPECKAYDGEWKNGFSHGWCCVLPKSRVDNRTTCVNSYGGAWGNTGGGSWHCYTEDTIGFKDGIGGWNDIDKHLQITSIKYAGKELSFMGHYVAGSFGHQYTEVDVNRNGYLDLDDLEKAAAAKVSWLNNLRKLNPNKYHSFQMAVELNKDAGNVYQTDKDGIKITFRLDQKAN